jgi:hypothetical protein
MKKQTKRKRQNNKTNRRNNKTNRQNNKTNRQNNKTNRRNNKTNRRNNKTNRRNNRYKRNLTKFIPENQGQGVSLFSIPENQKPFKIIVDDNHNNQFGNIIPGLREMQ